MTLYEINQEIEAVLEEIDPETGELTDEQFEKLSELQIDRNTKIENYALYIKNINAEYKAVKEERQKLQSRESALANNIKRVKSNLAYLLHGEKFKTPRANIYYTTSYSTEIIDQSLIPEKYLRFKDPEPKLADIKKAIDAGEEVLGASVKQNVSIIVR